MDQLVFECGGCRSKYVISPLDVTIDRVHFCPFCGYLMPRQAQPKDLTDERQLQLAVAGVR